jgi:hypothetical protein
MIYRLTQKLYYSLGKNDTEVIQAINETFNLRFKIIGLLVI